MKIILNDKLVVFDPTAKTIDFSLVHKFYPSKVLAIINVTDSQKLIYAAGGGAASPTGGSFAGNILTLNFDTSSESSNDALQIIYDETLAALIDDDTSNELGDNALAVGFNIFTFQHSDPCRN